MRAAAVRARRMVKDTLDKERLTREHLVKALKLLTLDKCFNSTIKKFKGVLCTL